MSSRQLYDALGRIEELESDQFELLEIVELGTRFYDESTEWMKRLRAFLKNFNHTTPSEQMVASKIEENLNAYPTS